MKKLLIISIISISFNSFSQSKFETNKKDSEYKFKVLKDLEAHVVIKLASKPIFIVYR